MRKYICISIKHSIYKGWCFWCPGFSGYTGDVERAGLYSQKDFQEHYSTEFPVVKMRKDLLKYYSKRYDSVLVDKDEFVNFTSNLRNCKKQNEIDLVKIVLHSLQCILTSESIEPKIRIEKALAKIDEIRKSN